MEEPASAPPARDPTAPPKKGVSVFRRRWRKFRTLKRGWYSFWILVVAYIISLLLPLLVNNRALVVSYEGKLYFPAVANWLGSKSYEAREFGQRVIGEAEYRNLAEDFRNREVEGWVLMPPYPFHPYESLLNEPDLEDSEPPHPPSRRHWMGTDDRGRDVLARMAYGFNISLTFALCVVFFTYIIGMTIGACLGYFGGLTDMLGQRFVEIWSGVPFLYTIIILVSIFRPSMPLLIFLLAIFSWIGISFYMRGEFYREKSRDYVAAAIAQGESNWSIMFRHILPNSLTPIISFAPFAIVGSIVALVSLDFLGFGLQPPTASWGELVNQGRENIFHWHLVIFPLSALFVTLLMVVFIGEAIREAFDPKVYARLR